MFGDIPVTAVAGVEVEQEQNAGGHGVGAGRGVILHVLGPVEQIFMIVGRVVETTAFLVGKCVSISSASSRAQVNQRVLNVVW